MNWKLVGSILFIVLALTGISVWAQGGKQLRLKGSDTELQLVANFAEAYADRNPDVVVTVEGGGSGTGIASLINGDLDIANSSRKMNKEEIKNAEKRGISPTEFIIARDGLAIIVHPNNPISNLTTGELSDIFGGEITNWSEVGGKDMKISLYGRRSTSGTYIYFRDHILNRNYSTEMNNMAGNQTIVDAVSRNKQGIGYVGVGYVTVDGEPVEDVKILKIAENEGSEAYSPLKPTNIEQGKYPIARPLYQYTDGVPPEDSHIYDFLKFEIESERAREIIVETGFFPPMPQDRKHNKQVFENGAES